MVLEKNSYELKYYCSKKKYYQNVISLLDIFCSVKYIQFLGKSKYTKYMKETPYYTKHIDLSVNEEELKQSFSKRVRVKINHAIRDGIEFQLYELNCDEKIKYYIDYCNEHLKSKKLLYRLSEKNVTSFLENYRVTCAIYNNKVLVMHGCFVNYESKTVYAHESVSQFRTLENIDAIVTKNFISKANSFLHYKDMLYFKEQGINTYDFGGYTINTTDNSLLNINKFKDGFRGKLIQQNHYESYIFFMITSLYHQIKPCVMKRRVEKIRNFIDFFNKE